MRQRGRKSPEAKLRLAVSNIADSRPAAPSDLTAKEAAVWDKVVAGEPADFFKTAAVKVLLGEFCRHKIRAAWVADCIGTMIAREDSDLEDVDRLMKMAERESRACLSIATKLRLTNQSRYTPHRAASEAAKVASGRRPW